MEPIYKFNNGNGAMLCNNCTVIISTGPETEQLYCEECNPDKSKYKLIREHDSLCKYSKEVKWISWTPEGSFDKFNQEAKTETSLIMSPFNVHYTWITTTVTEIVEQREDYIKFKTSNSVYELFKLDN
jgi:hypothetical protein